MKCITGFKISISPAPKLSCEGDSTSGFFLAFLYILVSYIQTYFFMYILVSYIQTYFFMYILVSYMKK